MPESAGETQTPVRNSADGVIFERCTMLTFLRTTIVFLALVSSARAEELFVQFQYCKENACSEQAIPTPPDVNVIACMKLGLLSALKWLEENKPPGYTVMHWRCGPRRVGI